VILAGYVVRSFLEGWKGIGDRYAAFTKTQERMIVFRIADANGIVERQAFRLGGSQ